MSMEVREIPLTAETEKELIALSAEWERENSCYGYICNTQEDLAGMRVFAAFEDGKIIGYLFGKIAQAKQIRSILPDETPLFEIEELYVRKEYRSQGIGRKLFTLAEESVKDSVSCLMLSTASRNTRAILHFYMEEMGMELWSARLFKKL